MEKPHSPFKPTHLIATTSNPDAPKPRPARVIEPEKPAPLSLGMPAEPSDSQAAFEKTMSSIQGNTRDSIQNRIKALRATETGEPAPSLLVESAARQRGYLQTPLPIPSATENNPAYKSGETQERPFPAADREAIIFLDWLVTREREQTENLMRRLWNAKFDPRATVQDRENFQKYFDAFADTLKKFGMTPFRPEKNRRVSADATMLNDEIGQGLKIPIPESEKSASFPDKNNLPLEKFFRSAQIVKVNGHRLLVLTGTFKDFWQRQPETLRLIFQLDFENYNKHASDVPFGCTIPIDDMGDDEQIKATIADVLSGSATDKMTANSIFNELTGDGLTHDEINAFIPKPGDRDHASLYLDAAFRISERRRNVDAVDHNNHGWLGVLQALNLPQYHQLTADLNATGQRVISYFYEGLANGGAAAELLPKWFLKPDPADEPIFPDDYAHSMVRAKDWLGIWGLRQINKGHSMGAAAKEREKLIIHARAAKNNVPVPDEVTVAKNPAYFKVNIFLEGLSRVIVKAGIAFHQYGLTQDELVVLPTLAAIARIYTGSILPEKEVAAAEPIYRKTFVRREVAEQVRRETEGVEKQKDPTEKENEIINADPPIILVAMKDHLCSAMEILKKLFDQYKRTGLALAFFGGHFTDLTEQHRQVVNPLLSLLVALNKADREQYLFSLKLVAPISQVPGIYIFDKDAARGNARSNRVGLPFFEFDETRLQPQIQQFQRENKRTPTPEEKFSLWVGTNEQNWQKEIEDHLLRFWPNAITKNPPLKEHAIKITLTIYPFMFFPALTAPDLIKIAAAKGMLAEEDHALLDQKEITPQKIEEYKTKLFRAPENVRIYIPPKKRR